MHRRNWLRTLLSLAAGSTMVGQTGIATGQVIVVEGKVTDANCTPLAGVVVEIWSANHYGRYRHEFDHSDRQEAPY